jgi:hypothetical protein
MSKFVPDVGTLFYAECTRIYTQENTNDYGMPVLEKVQDRSYSDSIFRMVALDNRMVVCDQVYGGYTFVDSRRMFLRSDWQFLPVGPAVAESLGLAI